MFMCPKIGEMLRSRRLERGLTLQDAAHKTRISVPRLRALERDDFDTFGSAVYARCFLALYSDFLAVDASRTIDWLHLHELTEKESSPAAVTSVAKTGRYGLWSSAAQEEGAAVLRRAPSPTPAIMTLFLLAVGGVTLWLQALSSDW